MGSETKIEWADHTFNPWTGCTKVSPACDHCYAESWAKRSGLVQWGNHPRRRTSPANWKQPLKWDQGCEKSGVRQRVFCASLADVFDNQVDPLWRMDLWNLIAATPHLIWMLLTKRPQNISKMLPNLSQEMDWENYWPWPNVWLGTTVENQEEADRRIPQLLAIPAAKHFLSCEPLLSEINIRWAVSRNPIEIAAGFQNRGHFSPGLETLYPVDWVIAGGESGPGARAPMIGWIRSLRDQCANAGTAFHFKQWGEHAPDDPAAAHAAMRRIGKKAAGALLDGVEHRAFP